MFFHSVKSLAFLTVPLKATEIPIFLSGDGIDASYSLDIPNNITGAELYDIISIIGIGDVLSIGNTEIHRTDTRQIAELSICPESVLNIIRRQPTDAESLYHFAKNIQNKELIPWWNAALRCHQSPESPQCEQQMVCKWHRPHIQCNEANQTRLVSMDTSVLGYYTHDTIGTSLSGKLVLRYLPSTVTYLDAANAAFDEVDLRGLKQHELRSIDLESNRISNIDLADLRGTTIQRLDLESNDIKNVDLSVLCGSSLRVLFLKNNKIQEIDLRGLRGSKLQHLSLVGNNVTILSLDGLLGSSLNVLNLEANPIEMIDFKGLNGSNLRYLLLPLDRGPFKARNVDELRDSRLDEEDIEHTLTLIEE